MVISKCSNLVCRKRQVQTRFNVFLSPFVAYKAVQFLSVYTMSDLHRQLSSYFMVEYHESFSLITFQRIWSPLHLNQQRLSHYWIVAYFALHQNTWTIAAWPWILCSAVRYLFVTQCCHPILAGRGRGISILIRKEHTISKNFVRLLQSFSFAQIGHVRCIINILTCSEALGSKLELLKVSFVSEFPKETWTQRKQQQIDRSLSWKPRSYVRILIYRTWHIAFRNIIIPLPRYHMPNLERAPLPLPHLFFDTFFDAVFLARPKLGDLRTETKCRKLMLGAFCEIPP